MTAKSLYLMTMMSNANLAVAILGSNCDSTPQPTQSPTTMKPVTMSPTKYSCSSVYDFTGPNVNWGLCRSFQARGSTTYIEACGYYLTGVPTNIYGKNGGGSENGLGIAVDSDYEINKSTFIQLDMRNSNARNTIKVMMGSLATKPSSTELFTIYGTNVRGSPGGTVLVQNSMVQGAFVDLPGYSISSYPYLNIQVGSGSTYVYPNVLLMQISMETSCAPTFSPTIAPTVISTVSPTVASTSVPTKIPTVAPTNIPTQGPTLAPTIFPTTAPTTFPTTVPTTAPSAMPSNAPTNTPTVVPTVMPSTAPTAIPTTVPTTAPSVMPSNAPTSTPTVVPTVMPSTAPTAIPTQIPTEIPTTMSSVTPSFPLSESPTAAPISGPVTALPTDTPTEAPTVVPSSMPTDTPTEAPTVVPSSNPTDTPTEAPTVVPSTQPTDTPTEAPTVVPSTQPTDTPTEAPTVVVPSTQPTDTPTEAPTVVPSTQPTDTPTEAPTVVPSTQPTDTPTEAPTVVPSSNPTDTPTEAPTVVPSTQPTVASTEASSSTPTQVSTSVITAAPSSEVTNTPSFASSTQSTEIPTGASNGWSQCSFVNHPTTSDTKKAYFIVHHVIENIVPNDFYTTSLNNSATKAIQCAMDSNYTITPLEINYLNFVSISMRMLRSERNLNVIQTQIQYSVAYDFPVLSNLNQPTAYDEMYTYFNNITSLMTANVLNGVFDDNMVGYCSLLGGCPLSTWVSTSDIQYFGPYLLTPSTPVQPPSTIVAQSNGITSSSLINNNIALIAAVLIALLVMVLLLGGVYYYYYHRKLEREREMEKWQLECTNADIEVTKERPSFNPFRMSMNLSRFSTKSHRSISHSQKEVADMMMQHTYSGRGDIEYGDENPMSAR